MKMKKSNVLIGMVVAATVLASCGGSKSSDSATQTTGVFLKNAAPTATTVPVTTTAVTSATTPASAATAPSPASTVAGPTTTIAVPVPVKVADPGSYVPSYLASSDPLGAPHPALPAEVSITANPTKAVSSAYRTDSSGTLTVASAEWVGAATPMTLRWNLTVGTKTIPCDNCAFVTTAVKRVIKAVLAEKLKGSGVTSVRGFDPASGGVGAFLGNGWAAEFVLSDATSIDATATGNSIRDWVLGCSGSTASTCRNVTSGIAELRWKNQIWAVADCTSALQNGGPRILLTDLATKLKGANADTVTFVRQRASLDRVSIALPIYRPTFATSGTARSLTGFASTGCAQ
jgi:hypothetical protein